MTTKCNKILISTSNNTSPERRRRITLVAIWLTGKSIASRTLGCKKTSSIQGGALEITAAYFDKTATYYVTFFPATTLALVKLSHRK